MNTLRSTLFVLAALLGLNGSLLGQTALPPAVLDALQTAKIPPSAFSLYVREVGRSTPLIDHRGSEAMNPASTMKLVTTLAALDTLGPGYVWQTDFLSANSARNGVLQGPLYIKGSGDPKFTWEHLQTALKSLRDQGISVLAGDIVLDRSYFAALPHDPAQFDGEPLRPYNVGPDALLFNFKSIGFRFTPLPNGRVNVDTDLPLPDGLSIDNRLRTHKGLCGDWRVRMKPVFSQVKGQAKASFEGTYGADCGERIWYVSLFDHNENSLLSGMISKLWRDLGGSWRGSLRDGKLPAKTNLLYRHMSAPLATMVTDINKFSNNVMARQLLLTLDAEQTKKPATAARAAQGVNTWFKQVGISAPELVIENGSGLSRVERIAPRSMASLLEYGVGRPFASDYISSLPVAAIDGTLRRRFLNRTPEGNAYLKTGTLTGVRSLAGYLMLPGQRMLLFVAFVNHANAEVAQEALDAAVEWSYSDATHEGNRSP